MEILVSKSVVVKIETQWIGSVVQKEQASFKIDLNYSETKEQTRKKEKYI